MLIDLVFAILMVLAIFKGMSKGFIVAVFSLLAFIVGLAAALKLSATVADYLRTSMSVSGYWLPILSFIIVFTAFVFAIRLGASLLKKTASIAFLGWADSLAGILLYAIMYLMVYSVVLFFATRIYLIGPETQAASKTYAYIEPFGPKVMSGLGKLIPFFSNMFAQLSAFFDAAAKKG